MATMFLALQCSQCSTMQVKQQKKSSNKWVCAVCNLRQSVCRVYAHGPKARDLRKFVQEFNMARMETGRSDGTDLTLPASDLLADECQPKKRMDWSEYLDPAEENEDGKNKENELDAEIVTEMPPQKPKNNSSRYQWQMCDNKLFRKNASKRKRDREGNNNQDNGCSSGGKEAKLCMLSNQRSRWSEYLDDMNDEEEIGDETVKRDSYCYSYSSTPGAKEEIATEHLVEDEVHPDFI